MSFFADPSGAQEGKGIRIITLNLATLLLTICLFCIVFYATIRIAAEYRTSLRATNDYMNWEKAAHAVHVGSDYLTEQARLYAETGDEKYARNYFEERDSSRSRERALEGLSGESISDEHRASLAKAISLSNDLTKREIYAMRLVAAANGDEPSAIAPGLAQTALDPADERLPALEKGRLARMILFDEDYGDAKQAIRIALGEFLEQDIKSAKQTQDRQMRELGEMLTLQRYAIGALFLLNALIFCMLLLLVIKPLRLFLKAIKQDKRLAVTGSYEFRNLALTYNRIFSIKEKNDKLLKHKAEHDPLTGLLNRGAFDTLAEMLKESDDPVGLLLIDVDKFKEVNDSWGHEAGDRTLCRVACLLNANFRSGDYCIRFGGDEFAVILKGATPAVEGIIMAKVAAMNEDLERELDDGTPPVSLSVGGAFSPQGFADYLYKRADQALYAVKEAGRRGCRFYDGPL